MTACHTGRPQSLGWSVAELAERSGLAEGQVRAVEAGHAASTLPLLTALSEALRVVDNAPSAATQRVDTSQ
ncbi:helix-turn-helix domain-containing protein [Kitasatospora sp. NPDC098652]|uniref:helix-turn-helix domain-containing protein n=1 Tax=Kitasatospora sp. NPDC098652 TaxID=3364095 RepID=UPI0037FD16CC